MVNGFEKRGVVQLVQCSAEERCRRAWKTRGRTQRRDVPGGARAASKGVSVCECAVRPSADTRVRHIVPWVLTYEQCAGTRKAHGTCDGAGGGEVVRRRVAPTVNAGRSWVRATPKMDMHTCTSSATRPGMLKKPHRSCRARRARICFALPRLSIDIHAWATHDEL